MGYDFCVLDRQIAAELSAINEKNTSIFVLIYWLGHRPHRLPIVREVRTKGRSQWNLPRKIGFTLDTLIGFTYVPARLISLMGFGTALLALLYLGFVLLRWSTLREAPPGWMTVVGLVTLFGALNLFALGILSEYLLRILDEARKRPTYIVERIINARTRSGSG
jgi:dolichol-phosphate mannosyltransferase